MSQRGTYRRAALVTCSMITSIALGSGSATAAGAGSPGAGDPYYPTDGNGGYDVADYNVAISYDPASKHLDGTTIVSANATEDLSQFNLDLHKLEVRSVKVNGADATFTRAKEHELVITPSEALTEGSDFEVEVDYAGIPEPIAGTSSPDGWQISQSGGAFAEGEPHSATTWFPANDHPSDKATFQLAATVPKGWQVVSNGVENGTTDEGNRITTRWSEDTPLATYLSTVAIDKWTIERGRLADGTPVVDAYAPGAEGMKEKEKRLPEVLDFLSSKFGEYPHSAAGGIFLADRIGSSLEIQTRPIYTLGVGMETIVHENAHEWYGDAVSVDKWRDICLNECFASYSQWLWREAKNGENLDNTYRQEVKAADQLYWARPLVDMGSGKEFDAVYDKGRLALHALRRQIGEDAFHRILKGWPAKHRDGNASWEDFEGYAEKVSGQNLDGFFQAWFRGRTVPEPQYLWPGPLKPLP